MLNKVPTPIHLSHLFCFMYITWVNFFGFISFVHLEIQVYTYHMICQEQIWVSFIHAFTEFNLTFTCKFHIRTFSHNGYKLSFQYRPSARQWSSPCFLLVYRPSVRQWSSSGFLLVYRPFVRQWLSPGFLLVYHPSVRQWSSSGFLLVYRPSAR